MDQFGIWKKAINERLCASNLGSMLLSDLCEKPLKPLSVTDAFRHLEKTLGKTLEYLVMI